MVVGPRRRVQLVEADVDDPDSWSQARSDVPGALLNLHREPGGVLDVEQENHVRVRDGVGLGDVETVAVRRIEPVFHIDDPRADDLGQGRDPAECPRVAAGIGGQDQRSRRIAQGTDGGREGSRVCAHPAGRSDTIPGDPLDRPLEPAFLEVGVEADVDRPGRLRLGHTTGAGERLGHRGDRGRLVIPLREIAHRVALDVRGVDPVDPRPPSGRVHRTGAAEHEDGGAIDIGIEDPQAAVEKPDRVMQDRRHRLAGCLGIPVGDLDRQLLMRAEDYLRGAEAVDERVMQAPEAGSGIQRYVRDLESPHQVDHDV